jgi:hypothetical protein
MLLLLIVVNWELSGWDILQWHNIHIRFHEDVSIGSEIEKCVHADRNGDLISLLSLRLREESELKESSFPSR